MDKIPEDAEIGLLNEPEHPRSYNADQYLRFLLRSNALIENIAAKLGEMHKKWTQTGPDHANYSNNFTYGHEYRRMDAIKKHHEEFLGTIENAAEGLRKYNSDFKKIYIHSDDSARIKYIGNIVHKLRSAKHIFQQALNDPRLNTLNASANGKTTALIEAIDMRLLPVIRDGETLEKTLREYHKGAAQRLAHAQRGKLPEGLDKVPLMESPKTKYPKNLGSILIAGDPELGKKIPVRSKTRRPLQYDGEGRPITGTALYQKIKLDEAEKLIGYSVEAEKSRNEGSGGWTRRITTETKKSPGEPER